MSYVGLDYNFQYVILSILNLEEKNLLKIKRRKIKKRKRIRKRKE